jgi:hypothetical protein
VDLQQGVERRELGLVERAISHHRTDNPIDQRLEGGRGSRAEDDAEYLADGLSLNQKRTEALDVQSLQGARIPTRSLDADFSLDSSHGTPPALRKHGSETALLITKAAAHVGEVIALELL